MSKEKQQKSCAICLEEVKTENLANLDCCKHIFCYECIVTWVTDCENSCPLCKKKIGMVTSDNMQTKVQSKKIEGDNFMYVFCECCRVQIVESDLQENPSNRNYAALCDGCSHIGLHVRCMFRCYQHYFSEFESFTCLECLTKILEDELEEDRLGLVNNRSTIIYYETKLRELANCQDPLLIRNA